jgi:hypothetical protein
VVGRGQAEAARGNRRLLEGSSGLGRAGWQLEGSGGSQRAVEDVECSVVCHVDTLCLKYLLEYLISGDFTQDYSSPHLDIKIQLYCLVSLFIGKVKHSNLHLVEVTIVRHQD